MSMAVGSMRECIILPDLNAKQYVSIQTQSHSISISWMIGFVCLVNSKKSQIAHADMYSIPEPFRRSKAKRCALLYLPTYTIYIQREIIHYFLSYLKAILSSSIGQKIAKKTQHRELISSIRPPSKFL